MEKNSKQNILLKLKNLKEEISARYKVKELELFGSVAREEQNEMSDIDVLVEFKEGADMFDMIGLGFFLEEELKQKVDVVSKRSLRTELRAKILTEAVAV